MLKLQPRTCPGSGQEGGRVSSAGGTVSREELLNFFVKCMVLLTPYARRCGADEQTVLYDRRYPAFVLRVLPRQRVHRNNGVVPLVP